MEYLHDISEELLDKVWAFLELTNQELDATYFSEIQTKLSWYSNIIISYDNDPQLAASQWQIANNNANEAMDKVFDKYLSIFDNPSYEAVLSHFSDRKKALAYMNEIENKSKEASKKIMWEQFYKRCYDNKMALMDTPINSIN